MLSVHHVTDSRTQLCIKLLSKTWSTNVARSYQRTQGAGVVMVDGLLQTGKF